MDAAKTSMEMGPGALLRVFCKGVVLKLMSKP